MSKLLLIGHSHVACFMKSAKKFPNARVLNLQSLKNLQNMQGYMLDAIRREIGNFEPEVVCLSLKGNDHNVLTLLEHPVPFTIASNVESPDRYSERWPIPYNVIKQVLAARIQEKIEELATELFSAFPNAKRFYLPPPPPIADWNHIKDNPGIFGEKLHLGFAPLGLKLAIYEIQIDILKKLCKKLDANFIGIDQRFKTADGFLKSDFFNNDPTHANSFYGELMMKVIFEKAGIDK